MNTPVTVIGGYLGAGKTTIVRALLESQRGARIAVIVNDVGAVNIDAALIADRSARRIDLTNGCACCAAIDNLGEACLELAAEVPRFDRIVIEASGVGSPSAIASWATIPGLALDGVVVVVDPETVVERLGDPLIGPTVRQQLAAADIVVMSRADLIVSGELAPDVRARIGELLVAMGSDAPIVESSSDTVPVEMILGSYGTHRPRECDPPVHVAAQPTISHGHLTATWYPNRAVTTERLTEAVAGHPGLVRAKGFVIDPSGQAHIVHLAGRRIAVTRTVDDSHDERSLAVGTDFGVIIGIGPAGVFEPDTFCRILDAAAHP